MRVAEKSIFWSQLPCADLKARRTGHTRAIYIQMCVYLMSVPRTKRFQAPIPAPDEREHLARWAGAGEEAEVKEERNAPGKE